MRLRTRFVNGPPFEDKDLFDPFSLTVLDPNAVSAHVYTPPVNGGLSKPGTKLLDPTENDTAL